MTHGTPAGLYANTASRYWEDDSKLPRTKDGKKDGSCKDIAAQLIDDNPGRKLRVSPTILPI